MNDWRESLSVVLEGFICWPKTKMNFRYISHWDKKMLWLIQSLHQKAWGIRFFRATFLRGHIELSILWRTRNPRHVLIHSRSWTCQLGLSKNSQKYIMQFMRYIALGLFDYLWWCNINIHTMNVVNKLQYLNPRLQITDRSHWDYKLNESIVGDRKCDHFVSKGNSHPPTEQVKRLQIDVV